MIWIFYVICWTIVDVKDKDMIEFAENNLQIVDQFDDPVPQSKNAVMAAYSCDDMGDNGFVQGLSVLGYTLMTLMPDYDRVLLVNTKAENVSELIPHLKKTWTHIIYRPPIKWPSGIDTDIIDKYLFKLQGWTVTGWNKILYLGGDVMVLSSLDSIFAWPTPFVAANMYNLTMTNSIIDINMDFIGFSPSYADYLGLLRASVKYIRQQPIHGKLDITQYIISEYFATRQHILPFAIVGENGGDVRTFLGNPMRKLMEISTKSVHFGGNCKPWYPERRRSMYSDAWNSIALHVFKQLYLPFNVKRTPMKANSVLKYFLATKAMIEENRVSETRSDSVADGSMNTYTEKAPIGKKRILRAVFLLIFVSLLTVKSMSEPFNDFVRKMGSKMNHFMRLDEAALYESADRNVV